MSPTQTERREASRTRILDAAVACLAERGYAGTTFAEVLDRAGLSNGALWRHFKSKAELMAAAGLHAEEKLNDWQPRRRTTGVDAAVEHFWAFAETDAFQGIIELLRASRTDPELAEQIGLTDQRAGDLFFDVFARLVGPELAAHPNFRRNGRILGLSLYGVGLTSGVRAKADDARVLADLKGVVRALF